MNDCDTPDVAKPNGTRAASFRLDMPFSKTDSDNSENGNLSRLTDMNIISQSSSRGGVGMIVTKQICHVA